MATFIFVVSAIIALLGGLGVVLSKQPIKSVLSLVLVMVSLSVLFLLLSAQFVFVVQIIVYAGAVMVLFLFVIALLGGGKEKPSPRLWFQIPLALLFMAILLGLLSAMLGNAQYLTSSPVDLATFGTVQDIALGLFSKYLYPFELTSLLLLVAAIGAVYLSRNPSNKK